MSGPIVQLDMKGLDKLIKQLKTNYYVDVGIIGESKFSKNGASVAGYGAVHEYGSPTQNIPRRSFIQMPLKVRQKQIEAAGQTAFKQAAEKNLDFKRVFKAIGIAAEAQIQDAFDSGGFGTWEPDKPETIENKGSDSILIDTGLLRKAISSRVGS